MDTQLQAEMDEMNRLAKQIRAEVEEMKKNFADIGIMRKPTVEELLEQGHTWEPWYAWKPVNVNGKWTWLKDIYRLRGNTYVDHDNWSWYYYGTILDVLKHAN